MSVQAVNYHDVVERLPAKSTLILRGVSWEEYEDLLTEIGENRGLRISYDRGTLHIMTLSSRHERYSYLINNLVSLLSVRLRIKVLSFGSATMKKQRQSKGVEPDVCFYVQNANFVGRKEEIDFSSDPPPDIAVEVDLHHESLSKFPIYAAFGVPEIWRYDGQSLTIYHLQQEQYVAAEASHALPMLTGNLLTEFLTRSQHEDQYATLLAFEEWLQTYR